ncbi:hypothetical protein [Bacillus alkalicola]|nr:hypothetical protein [Bacillus alkalicola]
MVWIGLADLALIWYENQRNAFFIPDLALIWYENVELEDLIPNLA